MEYELPRLCEICEAYNFNVDNLKNIVKTYNFIFGCETSIEKYE